MAGERERRVAADLAFNKRDLVSELQLALLHSRDQQRIAISGLEEHQYRGVEVAMLLNEARKFCP